MGAGLCQVLKVLGPDGAKVLPRNGKQRCDERDMLRLANTPKDMKGTEPPPIVDSR